jgi:PIN domain nuclease of toxin-antitoxin system
MASISLWEMASLFARGRIETYGTIEAVRQVLETVGVVVKPITQEIAILAAQFPESYPRDPRGQDNRCHSAGGRNRPDHAE